MNYYTAKPLRRKLAARFNQPKPMKRTPTQKEKLFLREIVGENGEKAHYFTPDPEGARRRRAASQVAQMREAANRKEKRRARGYAAQVEEMRAAASIPPLFTL